MVVGRCCLVSQWWRWWLWSNQSMVVAPSGMLMVVVVLMVSAMVCSSPWLEYQGLASNQHHHQLI